MSILKDASGMPTSSVEEGLRVELPVLQRWIASVLRQAGLDQADAGMVAANVAEAEARGVGSHGLILLGVYVDRIRSGGIRTSYRVEIVRDHGAAVVLDAGGAPGQVAAIRGVDLAVERCRRHGLAHVGVRGSNHAGMLATYGLRAARQGLVAIVLTTAGPSVMPPNGRGPRIGNNAYCLAVPGDPEPFVFDTAIGVVACGKIRLASLLGREIPPGWLCDAEGNPSVEPEDLDRGGAAIPAGGHKGYGFATMIDVISALMVGGTPSIEVLRQRSAPDRPTGVTQAFTVFDPDVFIGRDRMIAEVRRYVEALRDSPAAPGRPAVVAPGDPELAFSARSSRHGVLIAPPLVARMDRLAENLSTDSLARFASKP